MKCSPGSLPGENSRRQRAPFQYSQATRGDGSWGALSSTVPAPFMAAISWSWSKIVETWPAAFSAALAIRGSISGRSSSVHQPSGEKSDSAHSSTTSASAWVASFRLSISVISLVSSRSACSASIPARSFSRSSVSNRSKRLQSSSSSSWLAAAASTTSAAARTAISSFSAPAGLITGANSASASKTSIARAQARLTAATAASKRS